MTKKRRIKDIYKLTPMQLGMLYHTIKDVQSNAYNEMRGFTIKGKIEETLLEKSFIRLIERYDVFRTIFRFENLDEPLQIVLAQRKFKMHVEDLSKLNKEDKSSYLEEFNKREIEKGFDLSKDMLIRVTLFKMEEDLYKIVMIFHHILMDGWCMGIILNELIRIYQSLKKGEPLQLEPVIPFKNYIEWLEKQDQKTGLEYWKKYLKGYEHAATLPKFVHPEKHFQREYILEEYLFTLEGQAIDPLINFSKENQVTINTLFQTIWGILLQKYNNTTDVVFGAVVSGRPFEIKEIEKMVGLFINCIPVRVKLDKDIRSFSQLVQSEQDESILSRSYEFLPLADIQANSSLKNNLIDHIMIFENYPILKELEDLNIEKNIGFKIIDIDTHEQTNYDLDISIIPGNDFQVVFSYNSLVYQGDFINTVSKHFHKVITEVVKNPHIDVRRISIISDEEKKKILFDFNDTDAEYPQDKTIHELFAEQVEKTPNNIAVVGTGGVLGEKLRSAFIQITYRQLNETSNQVAHRLRVRDIKIGCLVGIMVQRSLEMVIGILGILKAGGAYLPIDPDYPQERIDFMLKDSNVGVLVTTPKLKVKVKVEESAGQPGLPLQFIHIHTDPAFAAEPSPSTLTLNATCQVSPTNLAYILYTSGSTGKPKGVMVNHPSVVNLLLALQQVYPFTRSDTYLLKTSYLFDVSVTELFGWYIGGGRLAILETNGEKDPGIIMDTIEREKITHINFVPSMFNVFVDELNPGKIDKLSLKYVFIAGEALLPGLVNKYRQLNLHIPLENLYGPTEGTVYASGYSLSHWQGRGSVPIGKPMPNTRLYILNKNYRLQPMGVPGELVISGVGLARGYLNKPGLTSKKFIINPFIVGDRIYQTGDLARWLADGNIEFLGRIDQQVKIRGYRIELGEIENQMLGFPGIKNGAVVALKGNTRNSTNHQYHDRYLCAYFVSETKLHPSQLKKYLSEMLPEYMIPSHFLQVENIPLTLNGKINKKALPIPEMGKIQETYSAPENEIEEKLCQVWAELLGIEKNKIGTNYSFFELGGHSLKIMMFISKVHKKLNIKIPLNEIFSKPTIKEIAKYIKRGNEEKYSVIEAAEEREYYELSSAQKRIFFLYQVKKNSTAYNMPEISVVKGELDKKNFYKTINELIKRHESFRTSFEFVNRSPVQRIHPDIKSFAVEYFDLKEKTDEKEERQKAEEKIIKKFVRPFDLSQAPLFRVGLVKVNPTEHVLLLDKYHIITDGISDELIIKEFMLIYEGNELPSLRIQYKDYSEWNNNMKTTGLNNKQERYWMEIFSTDVLPLEMPLDYPRNSYVFDEEMSILNFELDKELTGKIKKMVLEKNVTLYILLLAVYNILLSKYCNSQDIVVGTVVSGRMHQDLENIVGVFVNIIPIRNYLEEEKTFSIFLEKVKKNAINAFNNQNYPFETLVNKLNLNKNLNRNPLFDSIFQVQNFRLPKAKNFDLEITPYKLNHQVTTKFELVWEAMEVENKIHFSLEFSKKLYNENTIIKLYGHYLDILKIILQNDHMNLVDIELVSGHNQPNKQIKSKIEFDFFID